MSVSRLTIKNENVDLFTGVKFEYETDDLYAVDKLGKLEDLEEELGIDLITLFKALKDGIYVELRDLIKHVSINDLSLKFFGEKWCLGFYHSLNGGTFYVDLKDYGKIWALSRNDLEEKDDGRN